MSKSKSTSKLKSKFVVEWRLPSDRAVQPGAIVDAARMGDVRLRAASVVGAGHRCDDPADPRQDAYRVARDQSGRFLVIAVADGIGNARFSDVGASAAAAAAVRTARDLLDRGQSVDPRTVFNAAREEVLRVGKANPGEFACTLVVAIVPTGSQRPDGSRDCVVMWLGDSAVHLLRRGQWGRVAGDDKQVAGGIVDQGVANPLPNGADAVQHVVIAAGPGDLLAIVTDGVGDLLDQVPAIAAHFAQRWGEPPTVSAFLDDVNIEAPSYDDDRTAVCLWVDDVSPRGSQ